jgi:hypothetical protein
MNILALLLLLVALVLGCLYTVRNHIGFSLAALAAGLIVQFATVAHTVHF